MAQIVIFSDIVYRGMGRYAGAHRIATELRDHGYEVQVVDFYTTMTRQQVINVIKQFVDDKTLWVGFATTLTSCPEIYTQDDDIDKSLKIRPSVINEEGDGKPLGRADALSILYFIKNHAPNVKIVMGGKNSDTVAQTKGFTPLIDYVVVGQGETAVIALTREIENGIILTQRPKYLTDVEYPVVDYNAPGKFRLRFDDSSQIFPREALPMEIARGCAFKCAFCAFDLNGKRVDEFNRDPGTLVADLKEAYEKFGTTQWAFSDDTLNDSVAKVQRLHSHISQLPFQLEFSAYVRHDLLIRHMDVMAPLLVEMGLRESTFGIETMNHQSGKIIGKGMPPSQTIEGLKKLRQLPNWDKVIFSSGFIIGLPYETHETLRNTIDWILSDDCELDIWGNALLAIDDKAKMGQDMAKYGLKRLSHDRHWESKWMTSREAHEIQRHWDARAMRYYQDKNKLDNNIVTGPGLFFTQFTNLDFTIQEVKNGNLPLFEVADRKAKKINEYYNRLMGINRFGDKS